MRCPECNHTQKSREGSRCQKCSYQFVFHGKQEPIRDVTLRQIIQRLSDNGEYAFTATQLALEICRVWRRKHPGTLGCSVVALIISAIVGLIAFTAWEWNWLSVTLIPVMLLPLALWVGRRSQTSLPMNKAHQVIQRYHQIHPITGLADGKAFRQSIPTIDFENPHYAPERILVMERDELVDLLVRNRFHLTAKAAIVSRTGYPERVFTACQEFLRHHPTTLVEAIHDASLPGFALTAQLAADPRWAFAKARLVDLGIPRDALSNASTLPWLSMKSPGRDGLLGGSPAKRLQAGYRVPVDYASPKQMTNLLNAAIAGGTLLLASEIANSSGIGVEIDYG